MVGIIPPSTLQKWRLFLTEPHYTTRNDVTAILREFKVRNTASGGTFFFGRILWWYDFFYQVSHDPTACQCNRARGEISK